MHGPCAGGLFANLERARTRRRARAPECIVAAAIAVVVATLGGIVTRLAERDGKFKLEVQRGYELATRSELALLMSALKMVGR